MPSPFRRFTVRRLMVIVAISGLFLGVSRWVVVMRTRAALYEQRARVFMNSTVGLFAVGSRSYIIRRDGTKVHSNDTEYKLLNNAWAYKMALKIPPTFLLPLVTSRAGPPSSRPISRIPKCF